MRHRAPAPAGLIAKIKLGRGPRGLVAYLHKEGASVLWSNFASPEPRAWAKEIFALKQLAPRVQRSVVHASLSAPIGVEVTDDQFEVAARTYLQEMLLDPDAHPWALVRHADTAHQHVHLVVAAVNPVTRRAWRDSQSYAPNTQAAAAAARAAGIKPPTPQMGEALPYPPPTAAHKAARRERQRRRVEPMHHVMSPAEMAVALREAVSAAAGLGEEDLIAEARARGLELELRRASTGRITGLTVRQDGSDTWQKGSSLGRDLSWPAICERLEAYPFLRDRPS